MNYWWVNQNQTYAHEIGGGYLWSPKTTKNGRANHFYDNMTLVEPGDVIFSFCDTQIKAVGVATGKASATPKPVEFGPAGANWTNEGWLVPVAFVEMTRPVRPKDHMPLLGPTLPEKYSPLQPNGNGNQGVYLAAVSESMAAVLRALLGGQVEQVVQVTIAPQEAKDDQAEQKVRDRADIPETQKKQLILARRGQGLFRTRLELMSTKCRVTGVSAKEHLRASHIKPWRESSDAEKLDGNNGLLLAPHVDHLFDRGYIAFADSGELLLSPLLDASVREAWGIPEKLNTGAFTAAQSEYLAYHRGNVFRRG